MGGGQRSASLCLRPECRTGGGEERWGGGWVVKSIKFNNFTSHVVQLGWPRGQRTCLLRRKPEFHFVVHVIILLITKVTFKKREHNMLYRSYFLKKTNAIR